MDDRQARFIDAIEACRPGRDDLQRAVDGEYSELTELARELESSTELRQRFQATQQSDARIQKAFVDVPSPQGLADRIAAHIAQHTDAESALKAGEVEAAASRVETSMSETTARTSIWMRRRWLIAAAAAAVVLAIASPWLLDDKKWTKDDVLKRVSDWGKSSRTAWREDDAPAKRPWSKQLAYTPDKVANVRLVAADSSAAVYQYVRPLRAEQGSIRLYVLKKSSIALPASPPPTPQFDSQGQQIGVWAEGDLVYVLVVRSNRDAYRRLVRSSARRTV
jgi:hypothetical protein